VINSDDVVTVFAPTNAAIAQVPNWEAIVADPVALEDFVRSHAVAGVVTVEDLFDTTPPRIVTALSGDILTIDQVARTINGARIVTADTPATNGVVQTIDRLLIVPVPATTTTVVAAAPTTVAAPPTAPAG
jgi:uncharacterized surface protein with fasciclin (FAS1) repeats